VIGWFDGLVDQFYLDSWKIFVGMAVVFNLLSPVAYAMLRHRLGQETFFRSLIQTVGLELMPSMVLSSNHPRSNGHQCS
jgi:hypothetical protein